VAARVPACAPHVEPEPLVPGRGLRLLKDALPAGGTSQRPQLAVDQARILRHRLGRRRWHLRHALHVVNTAAARLVRADVMYIGELVRKQRLGGGQLALALDRPPHRVDLSPHLRLVRLGLSQPAPHTRVVGARLRLLLAPFGLCCARLTRRSRCPLVNASSRRIASAKSASSHCPAFAAIAAPRCRSRRSPLSRASCSSASSESTRRGVACSLSLHFFFFF